MAYLGGPRGRNGTRLATAMAIFIALMIAGYH